MLGTYVYFDREKGRLHLFRRSEKFLPAGTIKKIQGGQVTLELWAPHLLGWLGASSHDIIKAEVSIIALSREQGAEINVRS
jgi:hypothetical protein